MERQRAVILGAAGFIGSHLTDRFLAEGWEVLGVDNLVTGTLANLAHLAREPRFAFLELDICRPFQVAGPVAAVLDFASPASPIDYLEKPFETMHVGSIGVDLALQLAERKGACFLLSSTSEVYGDPLEHPQHESYWGHVNPIGPRSVYDEAKRFAEAITMAFRRYKKVETRIARIFNTYGPRMRLDDGRVVPTLVGQALRGEPLTIFGDGSQTRSFCYVDDEIEGIYRLFNGGDANPTNIGNPVEYTVKQLAELVVELTGTRCTIEYKALPEDDPKVRQPDITRARTMLQWEPGIQLRDGLERTIAYFRSLMGSPRMAPRR